MTPMLGVLTVRAKPVAYLIAPSITPGAIKSDLILIVRGTRAKSGRLVVHYEDGSTQRYRMSWDAITDVGPEGATAQGEYELS